MGESGLEGDALTGLPDDVFKARFFGLPARSLTLWLLLPAFRPPFSALEEDFSRAASSSLWI